jgi:HPt (histidine-containing phosphotransfer) domain-containing protein
LDPVNCTVRLYAFGPSPKLTLFCQGGEGKQHEPQTVNGFFAKPADAAAMSSALPAPVDMDHLARYTGGDSAIDREILTLFVQQSSAMLAELPGVRDAKTWRHIVHSLKGAARGIGAFSLADLAAEAEPLDPAAQRVKADAILAQLKARADAVQAFVEAYLAV